MRGASLMLRRLMGGRVASRSSSISDNLVLTSAATASAATVVLADEMSRPIYMPVIAPNLTSSKSYLHTHFRSYSSPPSSDASKVVSIESEEQFNDSLRKVKDESLPAVFYFTAVWCGPCRLLSPVIGQLSEKYPHVTTFKVDIDKEGLGNALSKLDIHSVPTLHFFQDGKKAGEVIGADVQLLKDTMEKLYK